MMWEGGKAALLLLTGILVGVVAVGTWLLDVTSTESVMNALTDGPSATFYSKNVIAYLIQAALSLIQLVWIRGWTTDQRRATIIGNLATIINILLSGVGVCLYLRTLSWFSLSFLPWDVARLGFQGIIVLILAIFLAFSPEWLLSYSFGLIATAIGDISDILDIRQPGWAEKLKFMGQTNRTENNLPVRGEWGARLRQVRGGEEQPDTTGVSPTANGRAAAYTTRLPRQ